MLLNTPELVLLDLDGTMVDTVPDLAFCIDTMLEAIDYPTRGVDKVRDWVGNGIERLVKRALLDQQDGEPNAELYAQAFALFLDLYENNNGKHCEFYPGVIEGLNHLRDKGIPMGCVTNKRSRFSETLLETLGVHDKFEIIISGDTLPKKKPDPLPLLHAAEKLDVTPQASLMIGDSCNDVEAARAAGFQVLCVSYGYNRGRDIHEASPDIVVDSLADLKSLF